MSYSRVSSRTDGLEFLYWEANQHQVQWVKLEAYLNISLWNFRALGQRKNPKEEEWNGLGSIKRRLRSPKTMEKMISKLEFCKQAKYQSMMRIENSNSFRYRRFPQIYFLEPFLRKLLEIALRQNEGVD